MFRCLLEEGECDMKEKLYSIFKRCLKISIKILLMLLFLAFLIVPFLHKLLDGIIAKCIWYPSCAIFIISFVSSVCKIEQKNKKTIFDAIAWMNLIPIVVIFSGAFVINYYDTNYNWLWCFFVLFLIYFPILVLGMRNFYKKENNYTKKELKTSAINASKYIVFYMLLDFFYMSIFNYWISDSNSKNIWLTLQFVFGIITMVFIFYSLTITFLSISKKNWFGLLQDFVLGIAITIYLIFIIPNSSLQSIVLTIIAAVYGGLLTLIGVAWTIKDTNIKRQKDFEKVELERTEEERKKHIPYVRVLFCDEPNMIVNAFVNEIFDLEKPEHISLVENNIIYCVEISDFDIKNISKENIILKGLIFNNKYYNFSTEKIMEPNSCCRVKASNNSSVLIPKLDKTIKLIVSDVLENIYEIKCEITFNMQGMPYSSENEQGEKYEYFQYLFTVSSVELPKLIKPE